MNATERFIMNFYQSINIHEPLEISKEVIVDCLNIKLLYWTNTSSIAWYNGNYFMFLNNTLTLQQQWQEFGHEMYHYFFDNEEYCYSYSIYGESKADYFSYHFCIPSFMLNSFKEVSVYDVMELFNVEYDFAFRRLEMYKHRLINRRNIYGERACEISW